MEKMLNLYFLYDDDFVVHEILWTQEDAEKKAKYYSCDYVLVQVVNDPNVVNSLLTLAPCCYPDYHPDPGDEFYSDDSPFVSR